MNSTVLVKKYNEPPINKKEVLRYACARDASAEVEDILNSCLDEISGKLTYNVCYREFPVICNYPYIDLGFSTVTSSDLCKNLKNCQRIVLFAATIGIQLDRLIAKYGRISPAKALFFQAIGTERIESLCDAFNNDIKKEAEKSGETTAPRFSPGYGDLPLELQKEFFAVLDCGRKIGLTLNDSLLMSPSKSVTAIVGIKSGKENTSASDVCTTCKKTDCSFRRTL